MGYFPFFMDIKDKKCIVVGGGIVALRKIEKLLPLKPKMKVIAPEICAEIRKLCGVAIIQRAFTDSDLDGAFMVISATDDEQLNSYIYEHCRERNILVNIVDDCEKCGFIFPALVQEKNITIGITTSGKSPIYARFLREKIEDLLDEHYLLAAEILGRYRPVIKREFDTERKRKNALEALLDLCLIEKKMPSDEEIHTMLEEMKNSYENKNWNKKEQSCTGTDEYGD